MEEELAERLREKASMLLQAAISMNDVMTAKKPKKPKVPPPLLD